MEISALTLYAEARSKVKILTERCHHCGAASQLSFHSIYGRYLISYEAGSVICFRISVDRYKCASCGRTHTLLPDILIPFGSYSILFVLMVLKEYFLRNLTVAGICDKYQIAPSTLYAWKAVYQKHKRLFLGVLASLETKNTKFIQGLLRTGDLSAKLGSFFSKYRFSFLGQKHKDATISRSP
jgi:ribosomal protein S27AE/transposase-like protein